MSNSATHLQDRLSERSLPVSGVSWINLNIQQGKGSIARMRDRGSILVQWVMGNPEQFANWNPSTGGQLPEDLQRFRHDFVWYQEYVKWVIASLGKARIASGKDFLEEWERHLYFEMASFKSASEVWWNDPKKIALIEELYWSFHITWGCIAKK